jgi:hypothetical protein
MSRLRFTSAQQVFAAFETAREDIAAEPSEAEPLQFLRQLLAGERPEQAISFCAYLLPRREGVWWACQAIRDAGAADDMPLLERAEAWVKVPEEDNRRAALTAADAAAVKGACAWAAYGAGWSGGNMTDNPAHPVRPPSYLTAKAIRVAVLMVLARAPPGQRVQRIGAVANRAAELLKLGGVSA